MRDHYAPESLSEALSLLKSQKLRPYAGGTDLMIDPNPSDRYLFLYKVPELTDVWEDSNFIHFGAGCTFSQVLNEPSAPAALKEALSEIAAPALRNAGTIGGNIANGSAKGDSALIFVASQSIASLKSEGSERKVPVESLYLGRKKMDIRPDELLCSVSMPKKWLDSYYYKKVGARKSLAISRISFAGFLTVENGTVTHNSVAFGAITDTILRRPELDAAIVGKSAADALAAKDSLLAKWAASITPTSGRVSGEYRKEVCLALLGDYFEEMLSEE
ncbi:MAG: FAD binding domain-containing protein [Clostridiales bacterium]|jgi:CO/xanthine dehydrogenase FAD-binding subunit|nr:FAD binding domain-containing protein [Clostridiales bacterium]